MPASSGAAAGSLGTASGSFSAKALAEMTSENSTVNAIRAQCTNATFSELHLAMQERFAEPVENACVTTTAAHGRKTERARRPV
jgi:hypothetical protein